MTTLQAWNLQCEISAILNDSDAYKRICKLLEHHGLNDAQVERLLWDWEETIVESIDRTLSDSC